jgi:transposase
MRKASFSITLGPSDQAQLEQWESAQGTPQQVALRCRIVLLALAGEQNQAIAARLRISRPTVNFWRKRVRDLGIGEVWEVAPGRGRKPHYNQAKRDAIINSTLQTKPKGMTHWSCRVMAEEQGVSKDTVNRLWQLHNLKPHLARRFKLSRDAKFIEKLTDVVGLYLNPLLGSADLSKIAPLLRQHKIPLVVDDVVATPLNIDVTRHADLIATSLTRFIVGSCDAMGGALICNPRSPLHQEIKSSIRSRHEELLWGEDAAGLEQQARTFPDRMRRHNAGGLFHRRAVAATSRHRAGLVSQMGIQPGLRSGATPRRRLGALITFLPKNANVTSPEIYDRLPFCEGLDPSVSQRARRAVRAIGTNALPRLSAMVRATDPDWKRAVITFNAKQHLLHISVTPAGVIRSDAVEELIQNGAVVQETGAHIVGGHFEAELALTIDAREPSWIALRVGCSEKHRAIAGLQHVVTGPDLYWGGTTNRTELGEPLFAHTSPIYVELGGHGVFKPDSARELIADIEESIGIIQRLGHFADERQYDSILGIYREAIETLRRRLQQ